MRPESKGGGRPIDSIWNCYRKVETPSGIHCVCLGCGANKAGLVKRMKEHAGACKPLLRKIAAGEVYYPPLMPAPSTPSTCQSQQSCDVAVLSPGEVQASGAIPSKLTARQLRLNPIVTPGSERRELTLQFARWVFASSLPFRAVEHVQLHKWLDLRCPGLRLCGERELGGSILDCIHEECMSEIKGKVKGRKVTLSVDGWSSITNEPLIGVSIHGWLLRLIDATGQSETIPTSARRLPRLVPS